MDVDSFFTVAEDEIDRMLGQETMTVGGQSFKVVWNDERKSYEGALGGLESTILAQAVAQPSDVTNPKSLLQKRATVDGVSYRVAEVTIGKVGITFTLSDPNAA
jgi:hypothetical protein